MAEGSRAVLPRPTGGFDRASMSASLAGVALSVLPVYLLGGLTVFIADDLDYGVVGLGAAASAFYAASAVASIPAGRVAHRLGAERSLILGVCVSSAALLAVALVVQAWWSLCVALVVGGVATALVQPAASALVARDQPDSRHGLSFGLLQTAVPVATLAAGLAVPVIGATWGWRWAYGLLALGAIPIVAFGLRRAPRRLERRANPPSASRPIRGAAIVLLTLAGACAAAPANALGAYYVESAVAAGISRSGAGLWLVAGSAVGIGARLLWGWMIDRRGADPRLWIAGLMLSGGVGFALLSVTHTAPVLFAATALTFGAGWAWKGLYNLAAIRHDPEQPSAAVGIAQFGVYVGSVLGPIAFGVLLAHSSYAVAWAAAGVTCLLTPVLIWVQRRLGRPAAGHGI
ncbi:MULTISPECIES: MFS transporter [unclassified Nocardioides]|uniref:MFS transporter n=1 Tax=unclassified Nocardioides TaxID=2615069 RepID=UPI00005718B9|nr:MULTISPECIES: MFS transporter [unclassified Nocardioides]ABL79580.1 major facilitator superfamily MFS_1 [Nocardioides sp. JS614]